MSASPFRQSASPSVQSFCIAQHRYRSTEWAKKRGHRLATIILSILNDLGIFFTVRFLGKFAVKRISKIPPHLAYVATLPCETLMSAKEAINDKLQGSVATYLRCGGVVNNQIKKGLLLSLSVKFFLNLRIFGKVTSKNVIVSCTFSVF